MANAATGVGSQGAQGFIGHHCGGTAATAATRHTLQVPGIAGELVGRIFGGAAHCKFVGVGFANKDSPGLA